MSATNRRVTSDQATAFHRFSMYSGCRRSSPGRFGHRTPFGTGLCAVVVHAEEPDHGLRVAGTIHPTAYPTRVGQWRVYRSPSLRYQLVTYPLGKGQVGETRAVQMPQLHLAVIEL
jgi:hypothetical protein